VAIYEFSGLSTFYCIISYLEPDHHNIPQGNKFKVTTIATNYPLVKIYTQIFCCRALELALMRVGLFPFAMNLLSFASKKNKKFTPKNVITNSSLQDLSLEFELNVVLAVCNLFYIPLNINFYILFFEKYLCIIKD
jgi:hypothetical protein